jgi:hypothetical protein
MLRIVCYLPDVIRMRKACSTHGQKEDTSGILDKAEENNPLGRKKRRWEDNIKVDLRELRWDGILRTELILFRTETSDGLL